MDATTTAFLIGLAAGTPIGWHFGSHNQYITDLLTEAEQEDDPQ
jgi:hypothetical protein